MKRKRQFAMSNPEWLNMIQLWMFRLVVDEAIFMTLSQLDCVDHVDDSVGFVFISPLYDYEEAWLEIYDWLEYETAAPDPELWGDFFDPAGDGDKE